MDFIDTEIQRYSERHTSSASDLLNKIERETHIEVLRPRMLSGHLQGRILSMLSKMIRPQYILEIGTYTGYSALCLCEGMQEKGKLVTIDINKELESRVRGYFSESKYSDQIDFRIAKALDVIDALDEGIEMVFIDADKSNYWNYFEAILPKMKRGGFILADNVLWSGKVVEPLDSKDFDTKALLDFNRRVNEDSRVENVLMPVRDGVTLIRVL
ncbi:O-methyltransferase [Reichenbachiella versicolor]|uniref:O-methyltransferase n=1 Tax=Reichenbachiella versicolor TaxID=1821036 RepID=UPI000D6E5529|nr:O-methyltransferase [Reichenbachiella versicolor]